MEQREWRELVAGAEAAKTKPMLRGAGGLSLFEMEMGTKTMAGEDGEIESGEAMVRAVDQERLWPSCTGKKHTWRAEGCDFGFRLVFPVS